MVVSKVRTAPPRSANMLGQLEALKQSNFSGHLEIVDGHQEKWIIAFYLGRIVYVEGGNHRLRRWQRQFIKYCPDQASSLFAAIAQAARPHQSAQPYKTLCQLFRQGAISRDQVSLVLQGLLDEVLWEILQAQALDYRVEAQASPEQDALLNLMNVSETLDRVCAEWHAWDTAGFSAISPNLSLVLRNPMLLQQRTSKAVFLHLQSLLDGQRTLRDLALDVKLDLLRMTQTLWPYIQENILQWVQVPDLPTVATPSNSKALIACIDDSPQICQTMERVIEGFGYRFMAVQDPLRGFSTLLQSKPDLIFLDLIMPNTNGYEVCMKMRRVSVFQKTPIIILTGNDGIIDRVRSKLVGSSGFISKPARSEMIGTVIQRHLAKVRK